MSYQFLNASLPIQKSPKDNLIDDFQTALDIGFKVASDWFTIQRENPRASETYENIDVRINRAFDGKTSTTVSDDYKRILFKNPSDTPSLGSMFKFDGNYWIVTNVDAIKSLATTCIVRRCNNMLRWKDFSTGSVYSQPCVIDYLIQKPRDYVTGGSTLVEISGIIEVITQFNSRTNKIQPSRRFLFGNQDNWHAFKLMGGGLNNFNNILTDDMNSVGFLRMTMLANQFNLETDDGINGVADSKEYNYSVSLNENIISINDVSSYQLIPVATLNGETVTKSFSWSSSDVSILTVDSSGVITPVSVGTATIKCSLSDNISIFDTCVVTVTSSLVDNYAISVSPNVNYIYEGSAVTFNTILQLNGVAQPDTFIYSINANGVPINNFQYNILSGNSFWIKNIKKFIDSNIIVTATSGSHSIQIPITLIGGW